MGNGACHTQKAGERKARKGKAHQVVARERVGEEGVTHTHTQQHSGGKQAGKAAASQQPPSHCTGLGVHKWEQHVGRPPPFLSPNLFSWNTKLIMFRCLPTTRFSGHQPASPLPTVPVRSCPSPLLIFFFSLFLY